MDVQAQWERLLVCLARDVDADELEVWFKDARPLRLDGDDLVIETGNRYYVAWIEDNYRALLQSHAPEVFGRPVGMRFVVDEDPVTETSVNGVATTVAKPRDANPGLMQHQRFDNFVVGECNKLAHAAALAVCDNPARTYNPLYIWGHTGLGKTHLMHAIGNRIARERPGTTVVYATAEDFTNALVNAIRYQRMEQFRARFREGATVLLIDDIQFVSGKERTQEEFFFTFNAMQASGRQVVLTSDVEPKDIKGLEPRLRTRFEGGLVADMQPPDTETLLAILHRKADLAGLPMPEDLAQAIADAAMGNVREVEGIINRLGATLRVSDEPLTLDFARRHFPRLFAPEPPSVTVAGIIEAVAKFHNLKSADITGKRRTRALTGPRHLAMFLARQHTGLSFPELGREFGDRDHSTIQHGVKKVEKALGKDPDVSYQVRLVEQTLGLRRS